MFKHKEVTMRTLKCFIGTLIAVAAVFLPARAPAMTNYYVATNGPHIPPFDDWSKAATNVQDVIARARATDRINFSNGTHVITGEITIAYGLTVRGAYGPDQTILTSAFPEYSNRCFYVNHHGAWLDGLTISNFHCMAGVYPDGGAGVKVAMGNLTNCVITHNHTIGGNTWGGGMVFMSGWTGLVTNCKITQNVNTSQFGGGIGVMGNGIIRQSEISGNTGRNIGGVFFNLGIIDQCVISDNVCPNNPGGGVGGSAGSGTNTILRNSLIMRNVATSYAGGVFKASNSFSVVNCTIVSNYAAAGSGMGIIADPHPDRRSVYNCIIYSNRLSDLVLYAPTQQTNWFYNTCVGVYAGAYALAEEQGNIQADPQFVNPDPADPDYHLLRGSPCINAGTAHHKMGDYDLDLMRRVDWFSRVVDMGCYENMPPGALFGVR